MKNIMNENWKAILLSSVFLLSINVMAGDKIDELVDTSSTGRVTIDVQSGNVIIKSWDKDQVQIKGELADEAEGYQFESHEDGDVFFKVRMPNSRWGNWGESEGSQLEIYLPSNNSLRFEGVNVDVEVSDINGGARVNTVNGGIKATNITKKIKLETVNGSIKSTNLNGRINLNTVNGEINDKNSQGELEIETVNGEIETETSAKEIGISNVNGEIKVTAKAVDEIEVGTVNGDIEIVLTLNEDGRFVYSSVGGDADIYFAGDVSANFNIETHAGGDIRNRLTKQKSKEAKYGPGESLRFQIGSGSGEVQIDTVSGDVTLNKK